MSESVFQVTAMQEYRLVQNELKTSDPITAYKRSLTRAGDATSSIIAQSPKIACHNGCSLCCVIKIDVRAYEALMIADYVKKHFTEKTLQETLIKVGKNRDAISKLSKEEHLITNFECPFLHHNSCSVYSVRPSKCRNFHSTNLATCKKAHLEPENMELKSNFVLKLWATGNGFFEGFNQALTEIGFDNSRYELNSACLEAMTNNSASKRFHKKKRALVNAIVVDD